VARQSARGLVTLIALDAVILEGTADGAGTLCGEHSGDLAQRGVRVRGEHKSNQQEALV